jgi:hypothetical protein
VDNAAFDAAPYSLLAFLAEAFKAKRTGTLRVQRNPYIQTAYLKEGRVAYASSNINEEKFGAVLKGMGLIGDKELALAVEKKEGKESLGKALMRLGFISNQDLYKAAVHQSQLITSNMITLGGATQFEEGRLPENLADLKVPGDQILRELTASINDRSLVLTALGGESGLLKQASPQPDGLVLQPEEKSLLDPLAVPKKVSELIGPADAGFPAARRLYFLLLCGAVESAGAAASPALDSANRQADLESTAGMPAFDIPTEASVTPPAADGDDGRTQRLHRDEIPLPPQLPFSGGAAPQEDPTAPLDAARAKFVTSELSTPEPSAPPAAPAPFVAMENLAASGRRPPVPTFGMDAEEAPKKKPGFPVARKKPGGSGGGLKIGLFFLLLLGLAAAYWALSVGPLAGKWFAALPLPEQVRKLLPPAMLNSSAPASTPISTPAPVNPSPVSSAVAPPPASSAVAPVKPVSIPAPPVSAPVKPVSVPAPVSASSMQAGRALLLKGDYPGAAKIFKAHLAAQNGYTIQMEVLCKPELSVPKIIGTLPESAPYMLVPVNFHGNPACFRELWGIYPSAGAAEAGRSTIAPSVKENAGNSGHAATLAQSLKENF